MTMYLFLDCETGGLESHNSLLTVAAIVVDRDFQPIRGGTSDDTLYLEIRHPTYIVTPEAITINRIDLIHHSARGVKIEDAQQIFAEFLNRGYQMSGGRKMIPAGHNLAFDLDFIYDQLIFADEWRKYVTYPALDTAILAQFFNATGALNCRCNLVEVCEYLGIPLEGAHNAMADTRACLEVARAFVNFQRPVSVESRPAEA
jgi:DNA polymerase III epsilon subunit-like protein